MSYSLPGRHSNQGNHRDGCVHQSNHRDGGAHPGNHRDGGAHQSNHRNGGAHQSNHRDGGALPGNHRDGGAQILQVNQLQHQYNMFTASSLLPQNQPPGTGENRIFFLSFKKKRLVDNSPIH